MKRLLPFLFSLVFTGCATHRADLAGRADALYRGYTLGESVVAAGWDLDPADARLVQDLFIRRMRGDFGEIAGYKAALTGTAAQKRFGIKEPVLGVLTRHMLYTSGDTLSPHLGARLMVEGDLVVRVASDRICRATTAREALAHLDAVYPFIEVPDLFIDASTPLSAPMIAACNTGARAGILGTAIPLENSDEWFERLGKVHVALEASRSGPSMEGVSAQLMGHPCNVVLWIRDAVAARGERLRQGHLLSLGSMTAMRPAVPGSTVRATYSGLDPAGDTVVEFTFTDN